MRYMFLVLFFVSRVSLPQNNIFDFKPDQRLFISYAFMNAAGNNAEWRKEGMDSIRIEVRKYLSGTIDSSFLKKIHEYVFGNHLESWSFYGPYALLNSGPPDFKINIDYKSSDLDTAFVRKVEGLRPYFIEFYKNYRIKELWERYRSVLEEENLRYKPYAANALINIVNYCRINKDYFSRISGKIFYQTMPLMSYFTAQTIKVNGVIYIISGPMDGIPSESAFYHEALHHPIGDLVKKYSAMLDKHSEINKLNEGKMGYATWHEMFEECLVRTIDKRLAANLYLWNDSTLTAQINNEYRLGMILCPYFNEELKKYELSGETLDEYFPELLENLNFGKEKERLAQFRD